MNSVAQQFALMQLSDSFFPSGSFTFSHGLESLVHTGQVQSIAEFQAFLKILLHNRIATTDLVALTHAYRASAVENLTEVQRIDHLLFSQSLIQESREAQQKGGRALLMVAGATWHNPQLDWIQTQIQSNLMHGLHPIVFAVVGHAANLSERNTTFAFVHSFLTGLCGAAIRLGLLGHLASQQVLKEISPEAEHIAIAASTITLDEMQSCTLSIDIAQMLHRRQAQRLFTN